VAVECLSKFVTTIERDRTLNLTIEHLHLLTLVYALELRIAALGRENR
jgi:hypothetical protein